MNDYIPQNGEWNEAYYMLSTMSLEGNVNGIRRMDPLSNHRRLPYWIRKMVSELQGLYGLCSGVPLQTKEPVRKCTPVHF